PFPDWVRALVIAIACELPGQLDLPLSRHFGSSVWRVVLGEGVVISRRREDLHPGPAAPTGGARPWPAGPGRERLRTARCPSVPLRLGRPARHPPGPLRPQDRDHPLSGSGRSGDGDGALPLGAPRLLD